MNHAPDPRPGEPIGVPPAPRRKAPRRFSADFKQAAVRRVVEGGERVKEVARELGVSRSALSRWRRELASTLSGQREPWDQTALRAALRGESEPGNWSVLLAEGVALQRKRIGGICRPDERDPRAQIDDLIADAAIGLSLIKDTQEAIDRVIHAGKMSAAKQLTSFRAEIRQGLSEIIDRIGTDALREAQARAEALCSDREEKRPLLKTTAVGEARSRQRKQVVRRSARPAPPVRARNRTRPLLLALAAVLLLWFGLSLPRLQQATLPVLTSDDFGHVSGVTELEQPAVASR